MLAAMYGDQLFNMGGKIRKNITILVIWGCYNKMPQTVDLNSKCLFPTNLETEYKIKGLSDLVSSKRPLPDL